MLTIPIVPSLIYAALLAVMGVALRRRLRAAWWVLLVWWLVLPEVARVELVRGDPKPAAIGFVIVRRSSRLRTRRQFTARRAGQPSPGDALFLVGGAVVLFGGGALVDGFGTAPTDRRALLHVRRDAGRHRTDRVRRIRGDRTHRVHAVIGIVGAAVVLGSATVLFRASKGTWTLEVADEARVRTLLRDFGELDSLGYFATRRDKSVVWDTGDPATARAGVSYRVVGSVSLASGNPVGDPTRWAAAIERWRDEARATWLVSGRDGRRARTGPRRSPGRADRLRASVTRRSST